MSKRQKQNVFYLITRENVTKKHGESLSFDHLIILYIYKIRYTSLAYTFHDAAFGTDFLQIVPCKLYHQLGAEDILKINELHY